jgi:hypothetical protein
VTVGLKIEGLGSIAAQFEPQIDERARVGLTTVGEAAAAEIVQRLRTDLDERGFQGRVNEGLLWRAIAAGEPMKGADGVWRQETGVLAGGDLETEAAVAEHGREAGHGISLEGRLRIRKWVERKFGDSIVDRHKRGLADDANRRGNRHGPRAVGPEHFRLKKGEREKLIDEVTFLVIRKIRLQGIPGLHPFEKTAEHLSGGEAARIFEEATGVAP